jgi:hypothetical protein
VNILKIFSKIRFGRRIRKIKGEIRKVRKPKNGGCRRGQWWYKNASRLVLPLAYTAEVVDAIRQFKEVSIHTHL